jgi:hypothetical protein
MSGDARGQGAPWRPARECALWLCAAWLVVQNMALGIALLVGGPGAAWHLGAPLLGVAFVLMTPIWLVPALMLCAGRNAGRRARCPETREVMR